MYRSRKCFPNHTSDSCPPCVLHKVDECQPDNMIGSMEVTAKAISSSFGTSPSLQPLHIFVVCPNAQEVTTNLHILNCNGRYPRSCNQCCKRLETFAGEALRELKSRTGIRTCGAHEINPKTRTYPGARHVKLFCRRRDILLDSAKGSSPT